MDSADPVILQGVGCLVLKKLSAAIEDGDNIVSVIREIGLNHDGRTKGLTMPSAIARTSTYPREFQKHPEQAILIQ